VSVRGLPGGRDVRALGRAARAHDQRHHRAQRGDAAPRLVAAARAVARKGLAMATRPRVRVGIVGAGFVAHIHGEAYRHVRGVDVELRAVTATRPERAQDFARRFAVARAVADFRAILADPAIDVVDLWVPAHHQRPMGVEAAGPGKHVIGEKPLTGFFGPPDTPRERMLERALTAADQVLAATAAARVRLCYAENWVYAPPIQKA